ncbi:MAG: hypothetical protein AAF725_21340 [Acidobacteriota bacterium]
MHTKNGAVFADISAQASLPGLVKRRPQERRFSSGSAGNHERANTPRLLSAIEIGVLNACRADRNRPSRTVQAVASELAKGRSFVQKAVGSLIDRGLLEHDGSIPKRGNPRVYRAADGAESVVEAYRHAERVEERVHHWKLNLLTQATEEFERGENSARE